MAEFLPCLGGLFGTAIKLGEYVVVPVKREFSYFFHYDNNIASLRDQVRILDNTRSALQLSVDAAQRNVQVIGPDVKDWLQRADDTKTKVDEIYLCVSKIEKGYLNGQCLNLKSRYLLSRKARKICKVVTELLNTGKFERISYPAPPSRMETTPARSVNDFDSRKSVERSILNALEDDNIKMIGLCGMGGVGKTTMVKYISEKVKEKSLFDEVVTAIVTQQQNLRMLQDDIAAELGLKLEENSLKSRAKRLCARIENVKRILLILDDIWDVLHLEELGVPLRSDRSVCKILLTSRLQDVCTAMEAQRILKVELLSEEEAWILFKEKAGDMVNSCDIHDVAMKIANECKGLPIALVTVAMALKGKTKPIWENALRQLKMSVPENIPGLLRNVYQPLKLSYNHLQSDEAKSLFLLCCLFQEDFNIAIENLTIYGVGLGMFARTENLAQARDRVHTLVEILKDNFLLLEGQDKVHVKMHDVVRDVAISIASHDFWISHDVNSMQWPLRQTCEDVSCISVLVNAAIEIPLGQNYPRLKFLLCQSSDQEVNLPEELFEGTNTLRIVEIKQMDIPSLPSSLQSQTNLQVIILHSCRLEDVSILGKLLNLEILSFQRCDIKVLPTEVGALSKLRLLDVRGCRNLQKIAPDVLSRLVKLEELHMTHSFQAWEVEKEGIQRSNASLTELESLSNLTTLKIQIPSQEVISGKICLGSKPTTFYLCIGPKPHRLDNYYEKAMDLFLPILADLGHGMEDMLQTSECLHLEGEGSKSAVNVLARNGFQKSKELYIKKCGSVEYIAGTVGEVSSTTSIFPILESMGLIDLVGLEGICCGTLPEGSFSKLRKLRFVRLQLLKQLWESPDRSISLANLKSIFIFQCHQLRYLFSVSTARSLVQLERLMIAECEAIEEVFAVESEEHQTMTNKVVFPRLSKLVLERLPCLTDFCRGFEFFEFPELEILQILNIPKLKSFYFTKTRSS